MAFGYGPWLLSNAFEAADEIEKTTGASIRLVNLPWLNRVDPEWLRRVDRLPPIDRHARQSLPAWRPGRDARRRDRCARPRAGRASHERRRDGLPECGTNDEVLAYHGLDVPGLVKALRQAVPQVA